MTYFWIVLMIIFILTEIFTSISLTTIWFIPGAIISLILCMADFDKNWQIAVFCIVSIVMFIITKPLVRRLRTNKPGDEKLNSYVGLERKVLTFDTDEKIGTIKINDVIWNIFSNDDIHIGDIVIVTDVKGNKMSVKKKKGAE